jgi:hypothetical protein
MNTYTNLIFTERNNMPGIKNRGSQIHKVKTKYHCESRKKTVKDLDDPNLLLNEDYKVDSSFGVTDYLHSYSIPDEVKLFLNL